MKKKISPTIIGNRVKKYNMLIFILGVIAVCVSGFCYTSYLQNKNEKVIKEVNRSYHVEEYI